MSKSAGRRSAPVGPSTRPSSEADAGDEPQRARCNGSVYTRLAKSVSRFCGRPGVFTFAVGTIVVWAVSGPVFGFSDTWQLWINTTTTIITFLMVFLIQNTQNRDTEAIQLKLDELIRANAHARNRLLDLEDLGEDELERVKAGFKELAEHRPEAANELRKALREIGGTKGRPGGVRPRR
jgi:low affinity Fe/Cu permease